MTTSCNRPPRSDIARIAERELLTPPPYDAITVQTRYLILASLATGLAILAAAAVWFSGI